MSVGGGEREVCWVQSHLRGGGGLGEARGEGGRDNGRAKDEKDGKKEINKVEEGNKECRRRGGDGGGAGGGVDEGGARCGERYLITSHMLK